jgi:ElaB/YqjD/DUF883 family membrane-anchored ribosome-binding protein
MIAKAHNRQAGARTRGRAGRKAQNDLRAQAAVVGRDMRDLAAQAGEAVRQQLNPMEQYVQQKPVQSLLIAAGVGALFGLLFLRR